jgi:hypothetical protein
MVSVTRRWHSSQYVRLVGQYVTGVFIAGS